MEFFGETKTWLQLATSLALITVFNRFVFSSNKKIKLFCKIHVFFFVFRMWVAIFFFVGIFCLLGYLDARKPKNYPPGPKWLPILGSAYAIHKLRQKTGYLYKAASELSKQYGPVVGLKIGKDRTVIVDGFEAIKQMLSEDDFSGRPKGVFYETRTWGIRRGLLLTDEDFWQEQRRFVLRHLREFGFGRRTMAAMVEEEAEDLARTFMSKMGSGMYNDYLS